MRKWCRVTTSCNSSTTRRWGAPCSVSNRTAHCSESAVLGGSPMTSATQTTKTRALDDVQSQVFTARDFRLDSGAVLPEIAIAYEIYGTRRPDGRGAILATHGYTGSHHVAGRYRPGGAPRGLSDDDLGSWDKLIGPGKAIDTEQRFVIASNMLGSSYGSTNPASIDPRTEKP